MSSSTSTHTPDAKKVQRTAGVVWGYKMGQMVALQVHLGDRLNLFKTLAYDFNCHFVTRHAIANHMKLHPRWTMELLRGLTAAKVLEYEEGTDDTERFRISPEMAQVLANEDDSLVFAAGAFAGGVDQELSDLIVEAFRTGLGYSYKARGLTQGEFGVSQTKRMLGVWTRLALVDQVIAALDGGRVVDKLLSAGGGAILDMGCGAGVAANCMAAAFPNSQVHGVDPDSTALAVARKDALAAGNSNALFLEALGEAFEPPTGIKYDMAVCLDIIHDCPRPDLVLQNLKRVLKPGGTLLIKDIKSFGSFKENLDKIGSLAMLYGFSISMCLSSSMSQPDGLGVGTVGFNPPVAKAMAAAAGFQDT
eukprot:gnl/TRDRNA2_/TRDRNA2_90586_c0_seq1.p1 gnl/TRDRNA2_/TRDRNA2_90586_c0~~gnl/TRDRNA2_/TRDRNA2_90586_c0_seq1.p1  ORF type:complete len:363 (+),score=56.48 gnl/TRDRNA2_/TRDRNA2_90586_c0_seq1:167-1255(+)